jgi:hypothetical protein
VKPFQGNSKPLLVGKIALAILSIHIAVCVFVYIVPERWLPRNKIIDAYRSLVVLGPFFRESTLKHSHFCFVSYYKDGAWSEPRQYARENFDAYSHHPWRVDYLARIAYEKQLLTKVSAASTDINALKRSSVFQEFNSFLTHEVLPTAVDSIHVLYGLDRYEPRSRQKDRDTLLILTYNPSLIARAKN